MRIIVRCLQLEVTNNATLTLHDPVADPDGVSGLVSFKWLKDQRMLREDKRPQCEATEVWLIDFVINVRSIWIDVKTIQLLHKGPRAGLR